MSEEKELEWSDEIEKDGGDFVVLPAGDYKYTIKGFERGRYGGGEKMGPCHKAILSVEIDGGEHGKTTITENLFLHTKTEGILCQFFRSIGARKSGENMAMNWGAVPGATGIAKISIRKYKKEGEDKQINQVSSWLDPKPASKPKF